MHFFGIPEINFSVKAFKLGMLRNLKGTYEVPAFAKFQYVYFFRIFYAIPN